MSTDSKTQVNGDYSETNLKTLKRRGAHPPEPRHVRRQHAIGRAASPRLRDRLQLGRRGARGLLQEHSGRRFTSMASITVADDGRGIPVGIKKDTGKSTLEEALTIAGNSGKFDNAAYRVSVGSARHGREGDERALRVVRGRGAPRRPRLQDGVRTRLRDERTRRTSAPRRPGNRHHHHLQARRRDVRRDHLRLRHARRSLPRDRLPQQGTGHRARRRARRENRDRSVSKVASPNTSSG